MLQLAFGFEKDRRNALAVALGHLNRADAELERLEGLLENVKLRRHELLEEGADIREVQENYRREVAVTVQIENQKVIIANCEEVVEKRREELGERMRERKTYERLRERAYDDYNVEMKREEMRTVDDVASMAFGRADANGIE